MEKYIRPEVIMTEELSEGIFAASGDQANAGGAPGCDSKYMNGVYHAPQYGWNNTMKEHYGCLGCPAYTGHSCGLDTHYVDAAKSNTYDVDAGNRMPEWERKGYTDTTIVDEKTHY